MALNLCAASSNSRAFWLFSVFQRQLCCISHTWFNFPGQFDSGEDGEKKKKKKKEKKKEDNEGSEADVGGDDDGGDEE
jgi:hypothetical protein